MKATTTQPIEAAKGPKMIPVSTAIMSNVITALVVGIACVITGYFISININCQARQAVVSDLQVVSKTQSR